MAFYVFFLFRQVRAACNEARPYISGPRNLSLLPTFPPVSLSVRNIIAWILQVLFAFVFIKSGFDKLSHLDGTQKMFGGLGLPSWFAYLIGGAELLGGVGLLPPTVRPAALALALVLMMLGTLFMHATKIPGGPG